MKKYIFQFCKILIVGLNQKYFLVVNGVIHKHDSSLYFVTISVIKWSMVRALFKAAFMKKASCGGGSGILLLEGTKAEKLFKVLMGKNIHTHTHHTAVYNRVTYPCLSSIIAIGETVIIEVK